MCTIKLFYIFRICSQKDIAIMKNEIEKRQREEDNNANPNQSSQALDAAAQNGTRETTETCEPTHSNGVDAAPSKLVAC